MYVLEEVTALFSLTNLSYFKFNDILHMLNVYKILVKDQEVLDSWATGEISVSELFLLLKYLEYVPVILRNCEKIKRRKIVVSTISRFLSA